MSDPRPLREGTSRLFDRTLLESAREDRAPEGSEERALAALAVSAVGIAAIAAHGAGAQPASAVASKLVSAVVLKWLGIGVAVTMAAAAPVTYLVVTRSEVAPVVAPAGSASGTRAQTAPAPAAPRLVDEGKAAAPEPELEAVDVSALASAPPPAAPSAAPRASAPVPVRSASSLSPELDVLDRARAALAAHDPASARLALDEYRRRFPQGSLREEAELAAIETLVESGDPAGAGEAASAFLAPHPASPFVGRVRAIQKRVSNP